MTKKPIVQVHNFERTYFLTSIYLGKNEILDIVQYSVFKANNSAKCV